MPAEIVAGHPGHVVREVPDVEREPLAPAVLAEELYSLADFLVFDAHTQDVFRQAATYLDAEPAHEIQCPACSAAIRAQMADQPAERPELTDARILDVLAAAWHADCPLDDPHPARHHAPQLAQLLPAIRQLITEAMPDA